jgi:hypothetical protein
MRKKCFVRENVLSFIREEIGQKTALDHEKPDSDREPGF